MILKQIYGNHRLIAPIHWVQFNHRKHHGWIMVHGWSKTIPGKRLKSKPTTNHLDQHLGQASHRPQIISKIWTMINNRRPTSILKSIMCFRLAINRRMDQHLNHPSAMHSIIAFKFHVHRIKATFFTTTTITISAKFEYRTMTYFTNENRSQLADI